MHVPSGTVTVTKSSYAYTIISTPDSVGHLSRWRRASQREIKEARFTEQFYVAIAADQDSTARRNPTSRLDCKHPVHLHREGSSSRRSGNTSGAATGTAVPRRDQRSVDSSTWVGVRSQRLERHSKKFTLCAFVRWRSRTTFSIWLFRFICGNIHNTHYSAL